MNPPGRSAVLLLSLAVAIIQSDAFLPVSFVLHPSLTMRSREVFTSLESTKNPPSFMDKMIDQMVNQDFGIGDVRSVQHDHLAQTANMQGAASQKYMEIQHVVGGAAESTGSQVYNGVIERSNEINQLQQKLDPTKVKYLQTLQSEQKRSQNIVSSMLTQFKGMSTFDKVTTFALPTLLVLLLGRYFISQMLLQSSLDAAEFERRFAVEMAYFAGDFEELDMCFQEYRGKMGWLRWRRRKPILFHMYLTEVVETTILRPKDLRSILYVMDIFQYDNKKLSEELLKLANEKLDPVVQDKLLFASRCLLGRDEAFATTIETLRTMIAEGLARDGIEPSTLDANQRSLAEDGYGAEVREAGRGQTTKMTGWKLVGLTAADSDRIFEEQKDNQEVYEQQDAWKFENGTVVPDDFDGGAEIERLQAEQDENRVSAEDLNDGGGGGGDGNKE